MRKIVYLAVAALAVAFPAGSSAGAAAKTLTATVGPGSNISITPKVGLRAGLYKIVIRDRSDEHNFHLTGPGVNKLTGVEFAGTKTFTVRLRRGTYRFVCDPHADFMKGSFRVR